MTTVTEVPPAPWCGCNPSNLRRKRMEKTRFTGVKPTVDLDPQG